MSFEATPEETVCCKSGVVLWHKILSGLSGARNRRGKVIKSHWACSAEPLAAVQAEVLDTVHPQASCQGICYCESLA